MNVFVTGLMNAVEEPGTLATPFGGLKCAFLEPKSRRFTSRPHQINKYKVNKDSSYLKGGVYQQSGALLPPTGLYNNNKDMKTIM